MTDQERIDLWVKLKSRLADLLDEEALLRSGTGTRPLNQVLKDQTDIMSAIAALRQSRVIRDLLDRIKNIGNDHGGGQ